MKDGAGGAPYINFAFPYSMMKVTTILITAACLAGSFSLYADAVSDQEEAASSTGAYSVAGALRLPENVTKRDVYGMNVGPICPCRRIAPFPHIRGGTTG